MSFLDILRSAATRTFGGMISMPAEKQRTYCGRFHEPIDDLERSFFQYQCQMHLVGSLKKAAATLASPLLAISLSRHIQKTRPDAEASAPAVFFPDGKPTTIIPASLWSEFSEIKSDFAADDMLLLPEDMAFLRRLRKRYPLSWHFYLKAKIKVAKYRNAVERFHPRAIIVCAEYSFTSSLLTAWCEEQEIEHIDVMHGEKLYDITDSFFRFHRCYIWDSYYATLFTDLRVAPGQFRTEIPPSLKFPPNQEETEKSVDLTYYLGDETQEQLRKIFASLEALRARGMRVAVRPHPRYTDTALLHGLVENLEVEDCKTMSVEASLRRTKAAASLYSTVLQQAFYNGVSVVIDDVTDPELYRLLREWRYIMLDKPHVLLSSLMKEEL